MGRYFLHITKDDLDGSLSILCKSDPCLYQENQSHQSNQRSILFRVFGVFRGLNRD